jgi:hypothetical protein
MAGVAAQSATADTAAKTAATLVCTRLSPFWISPRELLPRGSLPGALPFPASVNVVVPESLRSNLPELKDGQQETSLERPR